MASPIDVPMPRLSDSMQEGVVLTWLKQVGDEVAVGDELVEIETDKANMVYEADAAGTLVEVLVGEGESADVGAVIARLGGSGTAGSDAPARADGRVRASPVARRLARERGIELASVTGSGPRGRIVKSDIEALLASGSAPARESPLSPPPTGQPPTPSPAQAGTAPSLSPGDAPPAPPSAPVGSPPQAGESLTSRGETETVELTKLQQTVARRMAESKASVPHFYLSCDVDMSRCVDARARIKAQAADGEVVPSFNDMVVKATALALREFPRANGSYRDGRWELYSRINVGIAVASQDALVVPTIFDADRKGLRDIATEARALAERVRAGAVTPPELSGGTFTVSNLGMHGISTFQAVINPPQAGILAVGEIAERPVVRDGELTTAHLMGATLACDHRILYGADGAEFLARVRALLEEPLALSL
jgi:pyruvate dehydrogenase E2 component (dihydrolipoamide acetyltransferase)